MHMYIYTLQGRPDSVDNDAWAVYINRQLRLSLTRTSGIAVRTDTHAYTRAHAHCIPAGFIAGVKLPVSTRTCRQSSDVLC